MKNFTPTVVVCDAACALEKIKTNRHRSGYLQKLSFTIMLLLFCGVSERVLATSGSVSPGYVQICAGSSTTLTASISGATATSYSWAPSTGLSSTTTAAVVATPTVTTVYTVTISYSGGSVTGTAIVNVNAVPSLTVTGILCSANTLSVSSTIAPATISWGNTSVGTTTTSAGWQANAATVAGVTGSSGGGANQLNNPSNVYVDASGNMYIADAYNNRVQKWAPGATSGTTVAGQGGYGNGSNQLEYPTGVYVDRSGNLYVADQNNNRVMEYSSGASYGNLVAGSGGYGTGSNQLETPNGVYVDAAGNIFVSDPGNNRIIAFTPGASYGTTVAGQGGSGSGANQLNAPCGVYVDGNGNIYVSDKQNHRIMKYAPGASSGTTIAGGTCCSGGSGASQLKYPDGIYVDGIGNFYIADNNNQRIDKWAPGASAGVTAAGGAYGSGANQLEYPTGDFVDANGNIYVGDNSNARIQEFTDTIVKTYTPSAAGTYTVAVTAFDGCSAVQSFSVGSSAPATVSPITGTTTFCQAATTTLSDATTGGTWSSSNTAIATIGSSGAAGGIAAGTAVITYTKAAACNVGYITATVTVTPLPTTSGISGITGLCVGATGTLTDATTGGSWSAANANATVNSTGTVTGATAGTDIISYTVTNGCGSVSAVRTVTIKAVPSISVSGILCSSNTLTLTSSLAPYSIAWSSTAGTTTATAGWQANATTVAGSASGSGSSASLLNAPNGLYVDASGNLYIADASNNRVQKWAPGATSGTTVAGQGGYGTSANQLAYPTGVYVDASNNIYIADDNNQRIQEYTYGATTGTTVAGTSSSAGGATTQLNSPNGVYVDGSGNIYIADAYNNRLQVWTAGSTSGATVIGGYGSSSTQLAYPTGIFQDANGNNYIADLNNQRIQKVAPGSGSATTVAGTTGSAGGGSTQLSNPTGVYVDGNGYIYIADSYNNRVQQWAPGATSGITIGGTGGYGNGANQLAYPTGVYLDPSGNMYIADKNNNRIQEQTDTIVTTYTPGAAGNYSVTVSAFNGCSAIQTFSVGSSTPAVLPPITGTMTVCQGTTTTLSDASTGGSWSSGNTAVATVNGSGIAGGISGGSAVITYTKATACNVGTTTATVSVTALPTAGSILGASAICTGATGSVTDATTGGTWSAANSNATITSTGVVSGVSAGTEVISYTATNSCGSAYAIRTLTINAPPSISVTGILCSAGSVSVSATPAAAVIAWGNTSVGTTTVKASWQTNATTIAGSASSSGSSASLLNQPNGVYVDASGNVYIADAYNNRVQKWAPGATSGTTVAGQGGYGTAANQLAYPTGVYIDASNSMYISDDNNERIQKYASGATSGTTVAGTTGSGGGSSTQLNSPNGVYVDPSGNMYIADAYNNRLEVWAAGSTSGTMLIGGYGSSSTQLAYPTGVFQDANGNTYIVDENNERIQKVIPGSGTGTTVAGTSGSAGSSSNQLNTPTGVYVDGNGYIYIADSYNNRVQVWAPGATSGTTIGGTGGYGTAANQLAYPTGVYLDGSGNMYIADKNNNRVQEAAATIVNSYSPPSAGTYTVAVTSFNGCSAVQSFSVGSSSPAVIGAITGTTTVCQGSTTTLSDTASGGIWSSSNTAIATVSSSGVTGGIAGGTTTITYVKAYSCNVGTQTTTVTVTPTPTTNVINGANALCTGNTTTLTDATTGGTWSASNGNATVTSAGVVTGVTAGSDVISYTKSNSCGSAYAVRTLKINGLPAVSVSGTACPANVMTVSATPSAAVISWSNVSAGTTTATATWQANATTVAGSASISGGAANQLNQPNGVYVDTSGNIYIADSYNNRVQKWTPGATSGTTVAGQGGYGSGSNQLAYPTGVYLDASNNIYVVDHNNQRVQEYTSGASSGTTVGGNGSSGGSAAQLNSPTGVYVDPSGNMLIADSYNNRIQLWASGSTSGTTVIGGYGSSSTQLAYPTDVFQDANGNTYILDENNQRVQKLTPGSGTGTTVAGTSGSAGGSSTQLNTPTGVYVDGNGNIYIADSYNNRVQQWAAGAGSGTTIGGTGGYGSSSSQLAYPTSVYLDVNGNMYIADENNNRVQEQAVSINSTYTPTVSGTYSVVVTAFNGCSATQTFSVSSAPVASVITGASTACPGTTTTLTDSVTGGTWTSGNTSIATVNTAGVVTGVATGTVAVTYSVTNTCGSGSASKTITVNGQQWQGTTSTAWSTGSNWTCGSAPTATQDVVIPGSTTYINAPVLDIANGYTHKLTINATAALTLGSGKQLNVAGNLANNGTISGAGLVYLNGSSAQSLSGNGVVSNLTLANSAGASISSTSDTVGVTGSLLLNSGTLTTGGTLMLVSNSSGNGTIGQITGGGISGNVIVQQYIPGGRRAYRFIAHPFTASIALSQIETYMDITGLNGAANGFTPTTSNAPSAYWYNSTYGNSSAGSDPGWRAFTSTYGTPDSNMVHKYEGLRLFMRGPKGEGLTGASYTIDPATYRTYGAVNTGAQTIHMTKGSGAYADYNLLGNPYPAVTDIGSVIASAAGSGNVTGGAFYVWNPYMSTSGQFVTVSIGGHYYLGPNESFEVRTAANGDVLNFTESNKSTTATATLMKNTSNNHVTLYVYDSAYHPWDILNINFNDNATDNEDARYDGTVPPSPSGFNFYSLSADNSKLSLDARPYVNGKVIPLGIKSSYAQQFVIKADDIALPAGGQVYLLDNYLQTATLMQQGAEYIFTITQDGATQGEKRFELRMGDDKTAIAAMNMDVQMIPNPATDEVTITYSSMAGAGNAVKIISMDGMVLISKDLGTQQTGKVSIGLNKLASGVYVVEFTSGKNKVVKRLVKE
jgi:hypothetical protein